MFFDRFWLVCKLLFLATLIGCGGNNSSNTSPAPVSPTPTVNLSTSSESVEIDTAFTLSWSSTNATSCSASGSWNGAKTTSGSESITEVQIGAKSYTISCSGNGGQASTTVDVEITALTDTEQWDHVHIPYGTDDPNRQWLNIHLAYDQSKPMPIYLLAHGNGGSADGVSENELHAIASEGYATISWESIPTISNPDEAAIGVADAQVMFDWVIANADTYNLDPDHIVVGGRSRGSIISWQLAHSNHPSIKGIYMYNALPQSAWQDVNTWNPVDEITTDSPITYLVYGPDFDDDDGHNPVNVDPVLARYNELGIGDKITRYVDMWGDFRGDNGGWTNEAHTMHYFPEFAVNVEDMTSESSDFETKLKIQYGDHEEEYFLLWRKETSIKRPIVIWAHQGGGHPNNFEGEASILNTMDVHVLSWGAQSEETYTTMEEIDSLAYSVLDWVIANADDYKIDTNQIIISGQSRGSGYSWHLAYRDYPGIKGIYMAQALGEKVMESIDPTLVITEDAPPIFFTWKPGAGINGDSHTQDGAISVTNKYDDLGISDRVLGYELDNEDLYQYLPEFITNVLENVIEGDKMMLMGHSFFRPFADQLPYHAERAGIVGHTQNVEFSGGESGTPLSLWEDVEHRANVQAVLNSGDVDVFGMTCCDWELTPEGDRVLDSEGNPILSLEGWQIWFDYALAQNSNTEFFIGIPWLDYPTDYADAEVYADTWHLFYNTMVLPAVDDLRALYPGVIIYTIPYGEGVIELRKMFEAGNLPDITNLQGPNDTSLFTDYKGHGGQLLKDLVEYIWIDAIYGVNLDTYNYDDGYQVDLKMLAKSIMDAHDPNYNGPNRQK